MFDISMGIVIRSIVLVLRDKRLDSLLEMSNMNS